MAGLGARVVLVGRREADLTRLSGSLAASAGEDRFPMVVADMASLGSVRSAVDAILATESRLDVLVDNAGAIYPTRRLSEDGIEATLALMVVGPFALEAGLLPLLEATAGLARRSPSRRAGCTRSDCRSTTSSTRPARTPARRRTPGRSARRSR